MLSSADRQLGFENHAKSEIRIAPKQDFKFRNQRGTLGNKNYILKNKCLTLANIIFRSSLGLFHEAIASHKKMKSWRRKGKD